MIKRYVPFILLNIVVSAAVILGVLYLWEQRETGQEEMATATSVAATAPVATAAALATASAPPPDAEPTSSQVTHIVKAGDTLGNIAEQYDVPLDDIIAMNNIPNPNILEVGQELIIPIGGLPTPTVAPSLTPTSAEPPTPIPTEPPALGEAKVLIGEIVSIGDLDKEAVVIANDGNRQIQLANWRLEDGQGNVYVFKPFILFGDGANVVLHTGPGADTTFDLYWGLAFAVWESGETATLRDADGTVRTTFAVP